MFQRREFLAAVAAAGTLAGVPKFVGGAEVDRPLNWRSMTIQTTPKSKGNRAPVVTGVSLVVLTVIFGWLVGKPVMLDGREAGRSYGG